MTDVDLASCSCSHLGCHRCSVSRCVPCQERGNICLRYLPLLMGNDLMNKVMWGLSGEGLLLVKSFQGFIVEQKKFAYIVC